MHLGMSTTNMSEKKNNFVSENVWFHYFSGNCDFSDWIEVKWQHKRGNIQSSNITHIFTVFEHVCHIRQS